MLASFNAISFDMETAAPLKSAFTYAPTRLMTIVPTTSTRMPTMTKTPIMNGLMVR
jgi:tartrate dehydratase beta subunit/fumarate hydratase class I family protein